MTTSTRTDWTRVLVLGAIAGLAALALLTVGVVATLAWANSAAASLGEPTPVPVTRTVAVTGGTSSESSSAPLGATVELELQDGSFDVVPGPPGTDIRIEGALAENYYEIVEEHAGKNGSGSATQIRLRPTSSFLVRLMATIRGRHDSSPPNTLTVTIPTGRPIALTLRVSRGESRIDLGGLTLTALEADLSLGDHRLSFGRPLAQDLEVVHLDGGLGSLEVEHLGNTRAREIRGSSRMGDFIIDLGGAWRTDGVTELSFDHSMGELQLRIPNTVQIAPDSHSAARLGHSAPIAGTADPAPTSPVLRVHVSTTMGETRVTRYDVDL